ncbi:MAG: putative heme transporter [Acidimicrobiaceae bacterium]|nr:putative heme transporter [Acidimicrobiaceae bacterium]
MTGGVGSDTTEKRSGTGISERARAPVRERVPWRRSRLVVRIVLALLILIAVDSQRRSLLSATDRLGRLSPAWLALAVAAEILSFVAAAELQHHLLVGTGARVDRLSLLALTYAGTAMSFTLPAGPAVSGRYMYRTLVRRGSSGGAAAWVLAATAVLSLVSLVLLGLVGAQIRGLGVVCSAIGAGVGASILVIAAGLVWALVWSSRHQRRVEMLASSVAGWWSTPRRIMGHWLGRPIVPPTPSSVAGFDSLWGTMNPAMPWARHGWVPPWPWLAPTGWPTWPRSRWRSRPSALPSPGRAFSWPTRLRSS